MLKLSKNALRMLIAKYEAVLKNMSLKNSAALLLSFSLFCATPAWAEDVVYDDAKAATGAGLQTAPDPSNTINSLFPSTASDNNLTVDFTTGIYPYRIFGGISTTQAVNGNTVYFKNGATYNSGLNNNNVYGGYDVGGYGAAGNKVIMSGGTVNGYLIGGYSYGGLLGDLSGNVTGNSVHLIDGTVTANVYGGSANGSGNAENNSVTIEGGTVGDYFPNGMVYGGYSRSGDATDNNVHISGDATVIGNIYGGYTSGTGNAENNTVTIDGGTMGDSNYGVGGGIYGGSSLDGNAIGNSVFMSDGEVISIYGGESGKYAIGNNVFISGGKVVSTVVGGNSLSDAADNSIDISGGTIGFAFGGTSVGDATSNKVVMSDGQVYFIFGGASNSGSTIGNTVTITGGTIGGVENNPDTVFGGRSLLDATNNSVTISGNTTVNSNVYGGYSYTSDATGNSVTITGGTVDGTVTGGHADSVGDASGNTVTISGSTTVNGFVAGGYSDQNAATGNTVTISGSMVGTAVYGGRSYSGNAADNIVTISDGTVGNNVYGGYGFDGEAVGNQVTISGGEVEGYVYGGTSTYGSVTDNSVTISGNTKILHIYGGESWYNNATNNSVTISDNVLVDGTVTGGIGEGEATMNSVTISGNATVTGNISGGVSSFSDATMNSVTISGSPILTTSNIYGGRGAGDTFTGNTLNIYGFQGNVKSINNFENYNFLLPDSMADGDTMLTVTDAYVGWTNSSSDDINVSINLQGGGTPLKAGDNITLIDASASSIPGNGLAHDTVRGQKGVSLIYDFNLKMDDSINALTATVENVGAHPQTKALSEGRTAGMGFLNQGADLISGAGMADARLKAQEAKDGKAVFGAVSYGSSCYETGSHADVSGINLLAGIASERKSDKGSLLTGLFLEGGWGNYDTYNSFTNMPSINADGDVSYYGMGALIRRDMASGNYLEGSLRGGKSRTTFESGDFRNYLGERQNISYSSKPTYYGAHIGTGKIKKNGDKTTDYYAKYFWTHQNGDDVNVLGDPVSFSSSNSNRLRAGVRLSKDRPDGNITTYGGLAYEYEFSGKSSATVHGYDIDAPSLKGSTGIIELGMSFKTGDNKSNKLNLSLQGYVGQRKGLSGNVQFMKMF